jgi:hypothetical protein
LGDRRRIDLVERRVPPARVVTARQRKVARWRNLPVGVGRSCEGDQCHGEHAEADRLTRSRHCQNAVAGLQPEPIGHTFRQRGADRSTGLPKGHLFGHPDIVRAFERVGSRRHHVCGGRTGGSRCGSVLPKSS